MLCMIRDVRTQMTCLICEFQARSQPGLRCSLCGTPHAARNEPVPCVICRNDKADATSLTCADESCVETGRRALSRGLDIETLVAASSWKIDIPSLLTTIALYSPLAKAVAWGVRKNAAVHITNGNGIAWIVIHGFFARYSCTDVILTEEELNRAAVLLWWNHRNGGGMHLNYPAEGAPLNETAQQFGDVYKFCARHTSQRAPNHVAKQEAEAKLGTSFDVLPPPPASAPSASSSGASCVVVVSGESHAHANDHNKNGGENYAPRAVAADTAAFVLERSADKEEPPKISSIPRSQRARGARKEVREGTEKDTIVIVDAAIKRRR